MATLSDPRMAIDAALDGRRLLSHPFYKRWERGELSALELASYATQYRFFETYLPGFLARLAAALPAGTARDLVVANLSDEEGDPIPHVVLLDRFARSVGAKPEVVSIAMSDLIFAHEELLAADPAAALAGFLAYEY